MTQFQSGVMRESLLSFIRAVQEAKAQLFHLSHAGSEAPNYPAISFGTGYFDGDKVMYWESPGKFAQMVNEDAVAKFLGIGNPFGSPNLAGITTQAVET